MKQWAIIGTNCNALNFSIDVNWVSINCKFHSQNTVFHVGRKPEQVQGPSFHMAPSSRTRLTKKQTGKRSLTSQAQKTYSVKDVVQLPLRFLLDPDYFWYTATILLIGEFFLNLFIIQRVPCEFLLFARGFCLILQIVKLIREIQ
jgi:hypothetical protein